MCCENTGNTCWSYINLGNLANIFVFEICTLLDEKWIIVSETLNVLGTNLYIFKFCEKLTYFLITFSGVHLKQLF